MKKIIFTLIVSLAMFNFTKAQSIVDFESDNFAVSSWGSFSVTPAVVSNPHASAADNSANVLHILKDTADVFARGTEVTLSSPINVPSGVTQISFQVWTAVTGSMIYFKYGNSSQDVITEGWTNTLNPGSWTNVFFNISAGTTTIDHFYMFPGNWDSTNVQNSTNGDYYLDNFKFVGQSSVLPVDFESTSNFTLSSWTYTSPAAIVPNPNSTGINTSANVLHIAKDQANTLNEGVKILFNSPITVPQGATEIKLMLYTTNTLGSIYFKYCDGTDVTSIGEGWMNNPTPNNWSTITLNLNSSVTPGVTQIDRFFLFAGSSDNSANAIGYYYIDNIDFDVPTSIKNIISNNNLNIYPNPVKDLVAFNNSGLSTVQIYDVQGKIVYSSKLSSKTINVENLNSGIYFINVINVENKTFTGKFIKE